MVQHILVEEKIRQLQRPRLCVTAICKGIAHNSPVLTLNDLVSS